MIPNGAGSSSDMILVGHGSTDAKARAKQDRAQAALASLNPFANTAPPAPSSGTKLNIARQHSDTIIYKKGASMNAMKAQQVKQHSAPTINLDAFDPFSMKQAQQPQTRVQTQARQTSQSFDPFAQSFGAMSFDSPPKRHQNPGKQDTSDFDDFFGDPRGVNLRPSKSMGNVDELELFSSQASSVPNQQSTARSRQKKISPNGLSMPKGSKGRRRSRTSSSGAASSPTSNSINASQDLFSQEPNEWPNSQNADAFGQNTDPFFGSAGNDDAVSTQNPVIFEDGQDDGDATDSESDGNSNDDGGYGDNSTTSDVQPPEKKKVMKLQCPNCGQACIAPEGRDMFKCICGQVMVVPGTALAMKIQKQGTMKGHLCFVQDKSDMYGKCFLRVTSKKIFKKWSERFFSIQDGFILFFRSKLLAAQGATAVHKVRIHRLQHIENVEVTTDKACNMLYALNVMENYAIKPEHEMQISKMKQFNQTVPFRSSFHVAMPSEERAHKLVEEINSLIDKQIKKHGH